MYASPVALAQSAACDPNSILGAAVCGEREPRPYSAPAITKPSAKANEATKYFALSRTADSITGDLSISADQIKFANGQIIKIERVSTISAYANTISNARRMAYVFKVWPPSDPPLLNGNRICNGAIIRFVVMFKEPPSRYNHNTSHIMEYFSGSAPPASASSGGFCGSFSYETE